MHVRLRRLLAVAGAAGFVAAAGQLPIAPAGAEVDPAGTITNGTITLGLNPEGHLNAAGVGLKYNPTDGDGIYPGCLCEGWGAGDETSGIQGGASEDNSPGVQDVETESFEIEADRAVSKTLIPSAADPTLRVTHDYHPSVTPDLYEVTVTIENTSDANIVPRYRRAMDWDIPPTEFSEFVTIQGSATSSRVIYASDDGFADVLPFATPTFINFEGDAVDNGPDDHGALFDFRFDELAPGATTSFNIYYGASGNEAGANAALSAVNAEMYSYGQPTNLDTGGVTDTPNTFIFAFQGVGGLVQFPDVSFSSSTYEVNENAGVATIPVVLNGPAAQDVSVGYSTIPATATGGADYTEVSGVVTIPAGASSGTFEVPIATDAVADDGETVNLVLFDPVAAALVAPDEAVLTIRDVPPTRTAPVTPRFTG